MSKTPLQERIQRYVDSYQPKGYIPIHPKEYNELLDKSYREFSRLCKLFEAYGPILPLGVRPNA